MTGSPSASRVCGCALMYRRNSEVARCAATACATSARQRASGVIVDPPSTTRQSEPRPEGRRPPRFAGRPARRRSPRSRARTRGSPSVHPAPRVPVEIEVGVRDAPPRDVAPPLGPRELQDHGEVHEGAAFGLTELQPRCPPLVGVDLDLDRGFRGARRARRRMRERALFEPSPSGRHGTQLTTSPRRRASPPPRAGRGALPGVELIGRPRPTPVVPPRDDRGRTSQSSRSTTSSPSFAFRAAVAGPHRGRVRHRSETEVSPPRSALRPG